MRAERGAYLLAAGFAGLWALVEAIAHFVLRRYSPFQVVWSRYAVHLLLMFAIWGWRQPASLWTTRRPVYQVGRSLLMLVMPGTWAFAMAWGGDASQVMVVFWVAPLLVLVLAGWLLGERPSWPIIGCSLVGYAGMWLSYSPGQLAAGAPLVMSVLMALSFSLYVVLSRPLRTETTRANLFYTALGVFLALTPVMPRVWRPAPLHDVAIFMAIGVLGYLVLWCLDRFTARAPVSLTAPLLYLQVAFTTLLALGNGVGRRALLGMALIAIVALVAWRLPPVPAERST